MYKLTGLSVLLLLSLIVPGFGQAVEKPAAPSDVTRPDAALQATVAPVTGGRPRMDEFTYGKNSLKIHFLGHGTLMLDFNGSIIHIDPVQRYAAYDKLPKADLILITHAHGDHLDKNALAKIRKKETRLLLNQASFELVKEGTVLANGQTWEEGPLKVEAVPAYNTTAGRDKFHPKGRDNGYVLTLGQKRLYVAGDTEDIPEMAALGKIDIAFLPMNQPYTMLPDQVAAAAKMIKPKILYPYHYGDTDVGKLEKLMAGMPGLELRIRDMQ